MHQSSPLHQPSVSATCQPEGAADFYASLLAAAQGGGDTSQFYRVLGQTLRLAAEQRTAFKTLTLGGLYAKVDYLCKEHRLPWVLRQAVNAARIRIGARRASSEFWRHDLRAVAEFIAAVYGEAVPADLRQCYPAAPMATPERSADLAADYLRIVATRWDEQHLWGRTEDDGEVCVMLQSASGDWGYLTRLLHDGAQVNLVRPHRGDDGMLTADIIVYEPDSLVDVTAVTSCFEEYSHTPFLHLLHRLQPAQSSSAILLGNLAGALLDDEVHRGDDDDNDDDDDALRHDDVVERFLRDNALAILSLEATADLDLDTFLRDAEAQRTNIRAALHEGLERRVGNYDPANVMLEPSFLSEMLGLQGRMDFLQLDHRVLIEQKSGKGAWNPSAPDLPRQQLKHYVQMLLYMAVLRYNFHREHARHGGNLQAFLLYSKYADPLLGLSGAPQLLFEAFRVRNGLAWYEEYYAQGGARILRGMTADRLNQLGAHGTLWDRYQRPQLETLLAPIRQASPLESDYFFRMLQFVAAEHHIAKVGNNTQLSNCGASKWYNSLAEKHESGEIYDRLTLVSPGPEELALDFPADTVTDVSNFRLGDDVIVYPYDDGADPDCRRVLVQRGTLVAMTPEGVRVRLRAPQTDARVFRRDAHRPWAIEHDSVESSFGHLYAGLHTFLRAPQHRRDLLLLQRGPQIDEQRTLAGDYGTFGDLALHVRQALDFYLIIGPPGTGKTSFGMLYTLKEQLLHPSEAHPGAPSNVLLLSYTNRAVDEICSKLVEEGIPFLRIGNPHNCDPRYHAYLLDHQEASLDDVREMIVQTRVFVGTTTTMSARHDLFVLKGFDLAIIDEASQILEPHLLGLLGETRMGQQGEECAIRKFVMIGDHKQLPAVVQQSAEQSAVGEPTLQGIGLRDCRSSLFERLLRSYGHDPRVTYMLHRQGRMHRDVAAFPSEVFYEGQLDVVPLPHQVEEGGERLTFIPAPAPKESANDKVNLVEAEIIARLVTDIARAEQQTAAPLGGDASEPSGSASETPSLPSIGVIVPYRNQIAAIRSLLPEGLRGITIDTVERYQGSQRDHIIYGFTIQKRYQLAFLTSNVFEERGHVIDRKLNVAMTRARKHLYLVGNPDLLRQNLTFARLLDYCQRG